MIIKTNLTKFLLASASALFLLNQSAEAMLGQEGDPTTVTAAAHTSTVQQQPDTSNDAAIARSSSALRSQPPIAAGIPTPPALSPEHTALYEIIKSAAHTIRSESDVHAMTSTFARSHYLSIITLAEAHLGIPYMALSP